MLILMVPEYLYVVVLKYRDKQTLTTTHVLKIILPTECLCLKVRRLYLEILVLRQVDIIVPFYSSRSANSINTAFAICRHSNILS